MRPVRPPREPHVMGVLSEIRGAGAAPTTINITQLGGRRRCAAPSRRFRLGAGGQPGRRRLLSERGFAMSSSGPGVQRSPALSTNNRAAAASPPTARNAAAATRASRTPFSGTSLYWRLGDHGHRVLSPPEPVRAAIASTHHPVRPPCCCRLASTSAPPPTTRAAHATARFSILRSPAAASPRSF